MGAVNRPEPEVKLSQADLTVSGGGSILTGDGCCVDHMTTILKAKAWNALTAVVGISAWDARLFTIERMQFIRTCLKEADLITVRDDYTQRFLTKQLELDAPVHFKADLAFASEAPPRSVGRQCLDALGAPPRNLMGFGLRIMFPKGNPLNETLAEVVADCADFMAEKHDVTPVFVSTYGTKWRDRHLRYPVVDRLKTSRYVVIDPDQYEEDEILSIMGNLDLMFAIPLHCLILPALYHVPGTGVIYGRKVAEYAKLLDVEEYFVSHDYLLRRLRQHDTESVKFARLRALLRETVEKAWLDRQATRTSYQQIVPSLVASALETYDLINLLLNRGPGALPKRAEGLRRQGPVENVFD